MADQEPCEWDELRAAAIDAIRRLSFHAMPSAEGAVDAVLAIFDEEALNRMGAHLVEESRLRSIRAEDGRATLEAVPAREVVAQWVMASRALVANVENYSEIEMEFPDRPNRTRYAFTLQKVGKRTPHQMRKEAEAEVERLRAEVESLRGQLEVARARA